MRAASPPRQMELENEMIVISHLPLESSEPIEPAPPLSLAIKWPSASWTIPYRQEPVAKEI